MVPIKKNFTYLKAPVIRNSNIWSIFDKPQSLISKDDANKDFE